MVAEQWALAFLYKGRLEVWEEEQLWEGASHPRRKCHPVQNNGEPGDPPLPSQAGFRAFVDSSNQNQSINKSSITWVLASDFGTCTWRVFFRMESVSLDYGTVPFCTIQQTN